MANPFAQFGTPTNYVCGDCGVLFVIYPNLPWNQDNHNCRKRRIAPKICPCWWVLTDDHRVECFVVQGAIDSDAISIETLAPDGTPEFWTRRRENGRDVFYPPPAYRDGEFHHAPLAVERGAVMRAGPRQILQLVPRPQEETLALHGRKSLIMG